MFIAMRDQPDPALAALLKQLREEREVTQEQLAFDAGITASALSRIERGLNSPGWMTLMRIVDALDVSLIELASALERTR
ncbi:MAG TPA: helix-turn-helix transcriptional regulator [Solirubrobacteraceae bacterium]|jgi:transcriptional regulator with XRE-family HTH domain